MILEIFAPEGAFVSLIRYSTFFWRPSILTIPLLSAFVTIGAPPPLGVSVNSAPERGLFAPDLDLLITLRRGFFSL